MGSTKLNFIAALLLVFGNSVASTSVVTLSTPNLYQYVSLNANGIDIQPGQTAFRFSVKAKNDAHLALHEVDGDTDQKMYEVVIGGWRNTKSVIRTSKQGRNLVSDNDQPLSETEFRPFWVSWENGVIEVGTGTTVGIGKFMSWTNPSPHVVNYISVSTGFDSSGVWQFPPTNSCRGKYRITYARHPTDCTKFYRCIRGQDPIPMSCAPGTAWKQSILTCVQAQGGNCDVSATPNPCRGKYRISYARNPTDCTKFYRCIRGQDPIPMSCAPGTAWKQSNLTCVHAQDVNCDVSVASTSSCSGKRPVNGDELAFEEFVVDFGWQRRTCPSGKAFKESACECVSV